MAQSPTSIEFGESERIKKNESDQDEEPLNLNIRPSQLRASLMARARQSSVALQQKKAESSPSESGSRLSVQSNQSNQSYNSIASIASAFDSRVSARSSISSSISGWAPTRARSTSVSSQGSNGSVNLDALIADGSDLNEERPIELEEGDEVDWSKDSQKQKMLQLQKQQQLQQQRLQQQRQHNFVMNQQQAMMNGAGRSRSTTGGSGADMLQYEEQDMVEYWSESEVPLTEEDEEFDETLREFSQMHLKSSMPEVRGLNFGGDRQSTVTSPRFADGRNPFDLESDYADTPAGLRSGDRMSNISNYSSTSSTRSNSSRLPASNVSRLPGASGLKAPSTRLAQPATRSMLAQPKASASKIGVPRSGLQAPKAGAPRSGLQAPRAGSSSALPVKGSNLARPGANGRVAPGEKSAPVSRLPAAGRPGVKSQIAQPGSARKPTPGGSAGTGSNRQSLLQTPSKINTGRSPTGISNIASPKRTLTAPNLLASPARVSPGQMSSPSSSHSSSSSASLGSARDLSRRLSNATGTSQLMRPKVGAGGRSVSMYGSPSQASHRDSGYYQQYQQDYDDEEYAVLTPPLSPSSSKAGSRVLGGIPRSGIQPPSRLVAPAVSNSSSHSYLPRSHTPTSSLPVSRISSGLVSPRAGRH
ncbi:hypothetical protein BGZ76_007278 [Entomortierella beljakovae]|nr:hypothetical protein BGZ76_007278 [Entomortierella beljakovae]